MRYVASVRDTDEINNYKGNVVCVCSLYIFQYGWYYFRLNNRSLLFLFILQLNHPFRFPTKHVLYVENREEATAALNDGIEQLKMLQRQALVSSLYPSSKSVME
jgi:hypothetical protein